jgi:hypothetical protein
MSVENIGFVRADDDYADLRALYAMRIAAEPDKNVRREIAVFRDVFIVMMIALKKAMADSGAVVDGEVINPDLANDVFHEQLFGMVPSVLASCVASMIASTLDVSGSTIAANEVIRVFSHCLQDACRQHESGSAKQDTAN